MQLLLRRLDVVSALWLLALSAASATAQIPDLNIGRAPTVGVRGPGERCPHMPTQRTRDRSGLAEAGVGAQSDCAGCLAVLENE